MKWMTTAVALFSTPAILAACAGKDCHETASCGGDDTVAGTASDSGASGMGPGDGSAGTSPDSGSGGADNGGGTDNGGTTGMNGESGASNASMDAGDGAPVCEGTPVEGCTPSPTNAFFVDATATDGYGTQGRPLTTISAAIAAAAAAGVTDVYVCAGRYAETVHLNAIAVNLHGGFSCETWQYGTANAVIVNPGTAGAYALRVQSVPDAVTIEDLAFEAVDAVSAGGSSIAGFITESDSVTLRRATLIAGNAREGAQGVTIPFVFPHDVSELTGGSTTSEAKGEPSITNECPAGDSSRGGPGGGGGAGGQVGGAGSPLGRGGEGAPLVVDCAGGTGRNGVRGNDETGGYAAPGLGARQHGHLSALSGWSSEPGEDGSHGQVGGGGGGGRGAPAVYGGGGSGGGGAGGCGGHGGAGGHGGGSSVAMLIVSSRVSFQNGTLVSEDAGAGGAGDQGQEGQHRSDAVNFAGILGIGYHEAEGCNGGHGARGGNGGSGGGGAGGISAGILWQGNALEAPMLDDFTTNATFVGDPGDGGDGFTDDEDGIDGVSEAVLDVSP